MLVGAEVMDDVLWWCLHGRAEPLSDRPSNSLHVWLAVDQVLLAHRERGPTVFPCDELTDQIDGRPSGTPRRCTGTRLPGCGSIHGVYDAPLG